MQILLYRLIYTKLATKPKDQKESNNRIFYSLRVKSYEI